MENRISSENYLQSYNLLNEQQKQAVDKIEGPVMVLAGPGTGKTQILGMRIANILLSDAQVDPRNILCLTFTNAGRRAMRQRLIELTDTTTANNVNIHTYHSFCNEIIQEFPQYFDYNLELIDDLAQIEIIQQVQNEIPIASPIFKSRSRNRQIQELKRLFEFIKKEGIDISSLISDLQSYSDRLEEDPKFIYTRSSPSQGYQKGDLKVNAIKEERLKVQKAILRIELFPKYQELMQENGYFDYSDMINWVVQALEENIDLKETLQMRYLYLLVDEFQDTNGSQFSLVHHLSSIEHHDQPNVFVVGDDDQSIYRFQGANMKNLLDFRDEYEKSLFAVVLENNYRSSQIILDGAQKLIEHNRNRLVNSIPGLKKDLIASNDKVKNLNIAPRILKMVNSSQQFIWVAEDIQRRINEGTRPSDIAVLYTQHAFGNEFLKYLASLGIPFYLHKEVNFLTDPLGLQLRDLLEYLDSESRNYDEFPNLLFEIFGFPFWNISSDAGFMILHSYNVNRESYKESFRAYIHRWRDENKSRSELAPWEKDVIRVYDLLENFIKIAREKPLPVLINRIITQSGLQEYILQRSNKFWNLEILKTFVRGAEYTYEKNPKDALQLYVEEMQLMEDNFISLPVTKLLGDKSGVNMMSVHGSKGLEYKHVYMINCDENSWKESSARYGNALTVPSEFFNDFISNVDIGDDPEEKRRLFYVGITRAEQTLTISYPETNNKGDVLGPAIYVGELLEAYGRKDADAIELSPDEIFNKEWATISNDPDLILEPSEKEILQDRLSDYTMSVTALCNFLECPLKFYYNNLLKVPSGRAFALDFGTMMHTTLEDYYKEAHAKGEHLGAERLVQIYDIQVAKNHEKFIDENALLEIEATRGELRSLYDQEIKGSSLNVLLEKNLSHTFDHNLKIRGKLDKIQVGEGYISIMDYKTGTADKKKLSPPNLKGRGIGKLNNYWVQGLLYKLLVENSADFKGQNIKSISFLFLNETENHDFLDAPFKMDEEQYHYAMEKIYEAWDKIQKLDFSGACNEERCTWCNYQKSIDQTLVPQ